MSKTASHRRLTASRRRWLTTSLAIALGAAGSWSLDAAAQAVCVPDILGVPGSSGPPDWITPTTPNLEGHRDPRWDGALGVGHSDGKAHIRVLRHDSGGQRYLSLSLHATADPKGSTLADPDGDKVAIGIGKADGSIAFLITLRLDTTSATNAGVIHFDPSAPQPWDGKIMVESFQEWTGASYRPLLISAPARPILPVWLVDWTRLFVTCRGSGCVADGSDFNVQMRIPLGGPHVDTSGALTDASFNGGLEPNDDVIFFHRVDTAFNEPPLTNFVRYAWPERISPFGTVEPEPQPTYWAHVGAGPSVPCAGTIGFEGHHQVATGNAPPTVITTTTTFHARPRNNSASPVNPSHLKVQFRIADWGSALLSSPQWNPICDSNPADAGTTPVPSGSELDLACANPAPFPICDYVDTGTCAGPPPPTHNSHQCILAQLTSAAPPDAGPLIFGRESYWNNMDLRESSVVEEEASIATHGLAPLGSARDVYLYVQKLNMPPAPAPSENNNNNNNTDGVVGAAGGQAAQAAIHDAPLDPKVAEGYPTGALAPEKLEQLLPTYRVHVFHDSGAKSDTGARALVPAPSFGHYLYHQGPFTGWRDEITGAGVVRLSDTLYKLQIANDSVAKVQVRVESVEAKCDDLCGGSFWCELTCQFPYWWMVAFALVVLFIIVVLLRRRP